MKALVVLFFALSAMAAEPVTNVQEIYNGRIYASNENTLLVMEKSGQVVDRYAFPQWNNVSLVTVNNPFVYVVTTLDQTATISILGLSSATIHGIIAPRGQPLRMYIRGSTLYVSTAESGEYGTGGVFAYDVSNPASPRLVASFITRDDTFLVDIKDGRVYAYTGGRFLILNASTLVKIGQHSHAGIMDADMFGTKVVLGSNSAPAQLIDITNPARPVFVKAQPYIGSLYTVGKYGYTLVWGGMFRLTDYSDVANPVFLSVKKYKSPWNPDMRTLDGNLLYIPFEGRLGAVDFSNPLSPVNR